MKTKSNTDYLFLIFTLLLLAIGLVVLTSASTPIGHSEFGDKYYFIKKQLLFGVLPGTIAFFVFANLKYKFLKKIALFFYVAIILSLLLVFMPAVGTTFGTGAKSWIAIAGYSFQPSEFAKLGMIIFVAYYLSKIGEEIKDFYGGFLPTLAMGLIPVVLVGLQPDIGTASILFGVLFSMLFLAGAKWSHMGLLTVVAIGALVVLITTAPYRSQRLTTFLHPELDPKGSGYQINQAFLAIGSGGLFGRGLGQSRQKFQYLPEVQSDSIFSILAEEMGFIVSTAVILLFVSLFIRGLKIAKKVPDDFAKLTVSGIIMWLVIQTFLNIGAMVGLLPLTGVPLPFVSHGGTSMLVTLAAMGIVINISKYRSI